eukprot:7368513-Prymnesium_polylepis.1
MERRRSGRGERVRGAGRLSPGGVGEGGGVREAVRTSGDWRVGEAGGGEEACKEDATDVRSEPIGTPTRGPGRGRSALVQPPDGDGRGVRSRPSERERGGVWNNERGRNPRAGPDCTTSENDRRRCGESSAQCRSRLSTRSSAI